MGIWGRGAALGALLAVIAACGAPPGERTPGVGCSGPTCVAGAGDAGTAGPATPDAGGTPVPPPRGATAWAETSNREGHERAGGVAALPDRTTLITEVHGLTLPYATVGAKDVSLQLRAVDAAGAVRWTQAFEVEPVEAIPGDDSTAEASLRAWTTSSGRRGYVAGNVRGTLRGLAAPVSNGGFLLAVSATGETLWSTGLAGHEVLAVSARADASVWLASVEPAGSCASPAVALRLLREDGALERRVALTGDECVAHGLVITSLAATPEGGVLFGGAFSGTLQLGERVLRTSRHSGLLGELSASGQVVWAAALDDSASEVRAVAVAPTGQRWAAGTIRTGGFSWGATRLETDTVERVFLLDADARGEARHAIDLGAGERPAVAALDGGSAILSVLSRETGRPLLTVSQVDPGGVPSWSRAFPREEGAPELFAEEPVGLAVHGDDVTASGHFSHPTDFGTGLLQPRLTDTFVVRLRP